MRVSSIQKTILFVLYLINTKNMNGPIASPKLLQIINESRSKSLFPNNFRKSCHTLVDNGYLESSHKMESKKLMVFFKLTRKGMDEAKPIYEKRIVEMENE